MWKALQNEEYNRKMAMFVMMMEAYNEMGILPNQSQYRTICK